MNLIQLTHKTLQINNNAGTPLLDSIFIIPILEHKKEAIFIDHGLWSDETHQLLHWLYQGGLKLRFYYNENALSAIQDGFIIYDKLDDSNMKEVDRIIGRVSKIPYTMHNYVARHLLWEIPYMKTYPEILIRGIDGSEFPYEREVRGRERYYTLFWSKDDIIKYCEDKNIPWKDTFILKSYNNDKIKDMISEAIANNKYQEDYEMIKQNLKSWGYME